MYLSRNGEVVGYEGMSGWADDLWGTVKKAAGGFLKGGAPVAISTITGQPMSTATLSPADAWRSVRDAIIRQAAQRPDVQPILRQEALKSLTPYMVGAGVLLFLLLRRR
jgi:hypothetical protein